MEFLKDFVTGLGVVALGMLVFFGIVAAVAGLIEFAMSSQEAFLFTGLSILLTCAYFIGRDIRRSQ